MDRASIFEDYIRMLSAAAGAFQLSPAIALADEIAAGRVVGRVADIAVRCAASERTLRNGLKREVGVSPKRLLRVARFNRLIRSLHPMPWGGTCDRDIVLEYFDDAHLCREFQAMCGLSPRSYVRRKRELGDPLVHGYLI